MHEWTHVAVSYDGDTEHHFAAGAQVEEQACGTGGALITNDEDLRIGSRGHSWGGSGGMMSANSVFVGDIDEVMLYGAALSAEQIRYAYSLQYYGSRVRAPSTYVTVAGDVDVSLLPHSVVGMWPLDGTAFNAVVSETYTRWNYSKRIR